MKICLFSILRTKGISLIKDNFGCHQDFVNTPHQQSINIDNTSITLLTYTTPVQYTTSVQFT